MIEHSLITSNRCLASFVTMAWLIAAACAARAEDTPSQPTAAFPELPNVALARSKGVEADQDPAQYWADRVRALVDTAEKAATPMEKAQFQLAAANTILGRVLEPDSSASLAGLPRPEISDAQGIERAFAQAEKLISTADELLNSLPAPPPPDVDAIPPPEEAGKAEKSGPDRTQLLHAGESLQSFLNGMRAYLLEASDPSLRRRAASGLAPLLEDSDKRVSAAAKVWQALLRGNDPSAALKILHSPMATPAPEAWSFVIHAKVLRCRYQGMEGSWSAALVMLTYLEEQLDDWVPEAACRGDARRLFAWARLDVLKRWYDALPPQRDAERAWCAREAEATVRSYFGVETSLLRMEPAIPILVAEDLPKVDPK